MNEKLSGSDNPTLSSLSLSCAAEAAMNWIHCTPLRQEAGCGSLPGNDALTLAFSLREETASTFSAGETMEVSLWLLPEPPLLRQDGCRVASG
jgi:hypothetical protein